MRNIIIYDNADVRANLLPMTYTRPTGDLRLGILTLAEKWQKRIKGNYGWQNTVPYLDERYPGGVNDEDTLYIAGHIVADDDLCHALSALAPGEVLTDTEGREIGHCGESKSRTVIYENCYLSIEHLYDIFLLNGKALLNDFTLLTADRKSQPTSATNTIIGDASLIFIEEGATVEGAFINTLKGPVYVGRDAEIMEGSMLRGPIAICEHAVVNMGTKIYPDTTIGPMCKVGGELNNVVMLGHSNKAHDGFLGNAVIGEWCNIGAGCVASNLKNDYTPIRLWNYPSARFLRTGLQFCGLIMGDHSKAGINTMFNTATVVGVGVNIHGTGFPRNFVPSFSEGSTAGYTDVSMTKFFETASRMMARRGMELTEADKRMFYAIRESAEAFK